MDVSKLPNFHPKGWSATFTPMALPDMFAQTTAAAPDAPLVHFLGRTYSYGELYSDAQRFALALKDSGIVAGDRVGLFLPNVPIYVAAYYGAMMAGAVVVNFSPLYSVDELAQQVADSGTRMLVTLDVPELYGTAEKVLGLSELETLVVGKLSQMLPTLKGLAMKLFARSKIAHVDYGETILGWSDLLRRAPSEPRVGEAHPDLPATKPQDLALLQYTGGTTGTPKGAMLTHANLSVNAQQVASLNPFGKGSDEVVHGRAADVPRLCEHILAQSRRRQRRLHCDGSAFRNRSGAQDDRKAAVRPAFPACPPCFRRCSITRTSPRPTCRA